MSSSTGSNTLTAPLITATQWWEVREFRSRSALAGVTSRADAPTAASYTPNLTYQFNSTGAVNTITRSGVGVYTVHFPGLDGNGGTALVTAYGGGNESCKVASWGPRCHRSGAYPLLQQQRRAH